MSRAIELADATVDVTDPARPAHLSLTVDVGEFVILMGPNRSGKSLILELCAGLVMPREGTVRVLGSAWDGLSDAAKVSLRLRIGTVLHRPGLLSNMTVFNNVALPLRYHRVALSEADIEEKVMSQLDALAVADVRDRFPAELNPGEIRCAAIARAMVLDQELLLLDDPVAGLDADLVQRLRSHLTTRRRETPVTVLATLCDDSSFVELADRVAVVRHGRIESIGPRA